MNLSLIANTINQYQLPDNLYYIIDDGVEEQGGAVVEEVPNSKLRYVSNSIAGPSALYPVYSRMGDRIRTNPSNLSIGLTYIRVPRDPKWTFTVVNGRELFNPTATDFQDFEIHVSEFPKLVIRLVAYFGINLREPEIAQYVAQVKEAPTNPIQQGRI